jgi:hypothetical protein
MCFSASASFGAGIVLSAIGIASLKKTKQPSQSFFASIPLLFAVQQITEGFLWLALKNPGYGFLLQPATYIFLAFAQIIWPTFVPLAIFLLEKKPNRLKTLRMLIGIGAIISLYLSFCLFSYPV